jgi:hypothetical protein
MANRVTRVVVQILVGLLGLTGVVSGIGGAVIGPADATEPVTFELDSNFRFLSALLLVAGVVLLWCLPRIERATVPLRIVCAAVFLGGASRILSLTTAGRPSALYVAFIVAELVGTVLIVALQARLAEPLG